MTRKLLTVSCAICALALFAAASDAATIIKLNLGGIGPDVNGGAALSTTPDGVAATLGDQNTDIEYTGFLDGNPDVTTTNASFSLGGLLATGPANTTFAPLVIQNYQGGTFNLYDVGNNLLLSGSLTNSSLTGVIGPPGTGALFTTTFGSVTGGSLSPSLVSSSLTLSMNLSNVNGGNGFAVQGDVLLPFLADASVNIAGTQIPEPAALTLLVMGIGAVVGSRRRR